MAAQCLRGGAVDIARGGRRGARLRPASESQHRQAPHPFIVPSGLHAVRPDPKHAGKPPAPVDGNLHRHAGCSAAVLESIWSDLKYEGSPEGASVCGGVRLRGRLFDRDIRREPIPFLPDGLDYLRFAGVFFDLLTDTRDTHIDGAIPRYDPTADAGQKIHARYRLLWI